MNIMILVSLAFIAPTVTSQFIGGYALFVNNSCPLGTLDCGPTVSYADGPRACCPSGQVCHEWKFTSYGYVQACCATGKECRKEAEAANVCAADTWNLYIQGEDNPFCCTPDLVGYATEIYKGYGKCVAPSTELEFGDSQLNIVEQGSRGSSTTSVTASESASGTGFLSTSIGEPTEASEKPKTSITLDPSAATSIGNTISIVTPPMTTSTRIEGAESNRLSTGAIIGIVCAVVGVFLFVILGIICWRIFRRRISITSEMNVEPMGGIQN